MADTPPELMDALWEAAEQYGVEITVGDQVSVARSLAAMPVATLDAKDVTEAFVKHGLPRPPAGYGMAVVSRTKSLGAEPTLQDVLLAYRQFAIDALSAEFGGKTKGREESLRNNLRTYLTTHANVEARTGRGKTDIYIPELDGLIEVKVWTNPSTYGEGVEELARYIHTSKPALAFMVVFGDRFPLPAIASSPTEAMADPLELGGLHVPVIVVPFEVDPPSKALRKSKARSRSGR